MIKPKLISNNAIYFFILIYLFVIASVVLTSKLIASDMNYMYLQSRLTVARLDMRENPIKGQGRILSKVFPRTTW